MGEEQLEDRTDRREQRRTRLRNWALARTLDQAFNLPLAMFAVWILCQAAKARADEGVQMKDKRNVMTVQDTMFEAYDCAAPRNISSVELNSGRRDCRDEELQGEQKPYCRENRIPVAPEG